MDRLVEFRARLPEFDRVPDGMILAAISDAMDETDASVWLPAHYESAVRYLAAHKIALSPWGKGAKLSTEKGGSTYLDHRNRLLAGNAIGFRVTA